MAGEIPYEIVGKLIQVQSDQKIALVKVTNGNLYVLKPSTPGIDFDKLKIGQRIVCQVTSALERVYGARIIEEDVSS
jgi:hypothetical protein